MTKVEASLLLEDLKARLRITWNEEDEDLVKLIIRAGAYLSRLTGMLFDFSNEAREWEKELLLERCRYVYNNAADEFEKNFDHELKRLILQCALEKEVAVNETI